jgi:hypothetical protein
MIDIRVFEAAFRHVEECLPDVKDSDELKSLMLEFVAITGPYIQKKKLEQLARRVDAEVPGDGSEAVKMFLLRDALAVDEGAAHLAEVMAEGLNVEALSPVSEPYDRLAYAYTQMRKAGPQDGQGNFRMMGVPND